MTAQSVSAFSNRRVGLLGAYVYGETPIDSTADTALAAITTSSTVKDVLVILDACIARDRQTTSSGIGRASVTETSVAPTDIALSAAALATGANGSVTPVTVGTLSSVSGLRYQPVTFTLVSGTGSTNNGVFSITGTTLKYTGGAASAGTLSIRVRVTDSNSGTYEEAFTITVS